MPELVIERGKLGAAVDELRNKLAKSGELFDRDGPVKVVRDGDGIPFVLPMTAENVVLEAYRICRPKKLTAEGKLDTDFSDRFARLYLAMRGEWNLRPLAGISTAPLLAEDGGIRWAEGYDAATGLWCSGGPKLKVPTRPSKEAAAAALSRVRAAFSTFPFADAERRMDRELGIEIVDQEQRPGRDESAFLVALLTAVCRPSLWLSPGFMLVAPPLSGSGVGKGLLARAICMIAYGYRPKAFTAGREPAELDKRLVSELVEAWPFVFIDNINAAVLTSDTLASVLTERPSRARVMGTSRMVLMNSTAFVVATGNGLSSGEDLVRRFYLCELDPRCSDPETRPFKPGFLEDIEKRRGALLGELLTIWRFGRQNTDQLTAGRTLGSYELCGRWCRDPLLTLGCADPVLRLAEIKAADPRRQQARELLTAWWVAHGDAEIRLSDLAQNVREIADPKHKGETRQLVQAYVSRQIAGSHAVPGYFLERRVHDTTQPDTYTLHCTDKPTES